MSSPELGCRFSTFRTIILRQASEQPPTLRAYLKKLTPRKEQSDTFRSGTIYQFERGGYRKIFPRRQMIQVPQSLQCSVLPLRWHRL